MASLSRRIVETGGDQLSPEAVLHLAVLACEPVEPGFKRMRDLNLMNPEDSPRISDEWRRAYLNRPIERLPKDVMILFDRHAKLAKEKNQVQAEVIDTKRRLRFANVMIWILTLTAIGEGCAIGWLFKFVF